MKPISRCKCNDIPTETSGQPLCTIIFARRNSIWVRERARGLAYVRTRQSKKAREKDIAKMERELKLISNALHTVCVTAISYAAASSSKKPRNVRIPRSARYSHGRSIRWDQIDDIEIAEITTLPSFTTL
ncbi:hypothetical protein K0M31_013916 [Melipona bicolor]|uniref:Uncharacterized protein n=1 Tax=Melipona bicolor TaxID=60889 RepID=A0AA40G7I4_9HYME|nr:hypothetical protein K0M31_013916 [Melipona bicolor]